MRKLFVIIITLIVIWTSLLIYAVYKGKTASGERSKTWCINANIEYKKGNYASLFCIQDEDACDTARKAVLQFKDEIGITKISDCKER